jgi:hypothetical protein
LFGFVFWANWQRYGASATRFLLPGSGRYVLTNFYRLILLGALTIVCGLFFLANLPVLFAADEPASVDADDPKKSSSRAGCLIVRGCPRTPSATVRGQLSAE